VTDAVIGAITNRWILVTQGSCVTNNEFYLSFWIGNHLAPSDIVKD